MILLSIDTSADYVSVAVVTDQKVLAHVHVQMARGQAECLIPLIQQTLKESSITPDQLTDIAVNVGPGSFTGVRVGLACARAFALALKLPVHGVTAFEAAALDQKKSIIVVLDSKRDDYFMQAFDARGQPMAEASLQTSEQLQKMLPFVAIGSGALKLKSEIGCDVAEPAYASAIAVAKIAEARHNNPMPAEPLYMRQADVTC